MRKSHKYAGVKAHLTAGFLLVVTVIPVVWMVLSSFKTTPELSGVEKRLLPTGLYLGHYEKVVQTNLFSYFLNSTLVAVGTTLIALAVAVLAGYGFSRFTFFGNRAMLLVVIACQMFPAVLLAMPLFKTVRTLGLLDSLVGLTLVYVTFALPLCIWLMRNYFMGMSPSIEEAAMIDGCSRFQALRRVLLPSAMPGIMAAAVFCIILVWEEYLYASIFIETDGKRTLSVGLKSLMGEFTTDWGQLLAAGVLMMIPILLVFSYLQRYVTQIAAGGDKG